MRSSINNITEKITIEKRKRVRSQCYERSVLWEKKIPLQKKGIMKEKNCWTRRALFKRHKFVAFEDRKLNYKKCYYIREKFFWEREAYDNKMFGRTSQKVWRKTFYHRERRRERVGFATTQRRRREDARVGSEQESLGCFFFKSAWQAEN